MELVPEQLAPASALIASLAPAQRLALAYAAPLARRPTLALMALDVRLAGIVRSAREPLLVQLRLAWWRDRLREDPAGWPAGEPVLAALADWGDRAGGLAALVDGWEELTGASPLDGAAFARFADGRAESWGVLAGRLAGDADDPAAYRAARGWALADLALHLSDPAERATLAPVLAAHDWRPLRLPRALRPLGVLYALARRARGTRPLLAGPGALVTALRVGIVGS